ncbi:hypothetical protein [Kutzneria sp. CA-103260]|uniref:hypothetical protein n=1 Tax=Kutzneria sp. CA-103260 TaxID=2802641 RepID=UPI001BACC19B|nr:hypothetical protein [Kutzneria sp. CA-103260]QUQ68282.1 hypothetical protein JJ691_60270 [Kutzneria sp. CA-103260]
MSVWWVNQGRTYAAERDGSFLWAPISGKNGVRPAHWTAMSMVRPGDVVLHYANGAIRAVSRAPQPAVPAARPQSLPTDLWEAEGWLLRVSMQELAEPIGRDEIPSPLRMQWSQPMFTAQGTVNQGYLFPVGLEWFAHFSHLFADRLAGTAAHQPDTPVEVREGAEMLLRGLLGQKLETLSGAENFITAVSGDNVVVATNQSPGGQPVPIATVQAALDTLRREVSVCGLRTCLTFCRRETLDTIPG